jgi:hypothetical protein
MKGVFKLNMERQTNFLGTYFNKNIVLHISNFAKVFSWIVGGIYSLQWLIQLLATVLQITRGFWSGMGVTDILINVFSLFEPPLRGIVYFVVLQGVAHALLLFMDMEDNTRRTARGVEHK